MHGRSIYVGVGVFVAFVFIILGLTLNGGSGPLPAATYGPANARFVISFSEHPVMRDLANPQEPNKYLENISSQFSLYVAALGAKSYESVSIDEYPRPLTLKSINWYLHDYLFGFHVSKWHGLPAAEMDIACHVGDTSQSCPGRLSYRVIISGRVIYSLDAIQIGESEAERFFGSFHQA